MLNKSWQCIEPVFIFNIAEGKKSGETHSKPSCSITCLLVGSEKEYVKRFPILVVTAKPELGAKKKKNDF